MIKMISDSDDVNLMMEFRDTYDKQWKAFLVRKRLWSEWVRYCKR